MGGVKKIRPPSGDMASSAPLGQYSSSTNRAQYSLTLSSESGSVKRVQQRQKTLAEVDQKRTSRSINQVTATTWISSAEDSEIESWPS